MNDRRTLTRRDIRNAALTLRAEVASGTAVQHWFTVQDVVERLDHRVDPDEVEETLLTMAKRGLLLPQPDAVATYRFSPPETLREDRLPGRHGRPRSTRG